MPVTIIHDGGYETNYYLKGNGKTVNNCAACSTLLATVHRVKVEKN